MDHQTLWYKDAVIYEVYVRAFYDSNGDGHGDLRGVTQKMDYLKDLGVNCLWLLPIYPSPLKDDGDVCCGNTISTSTMYAAPARMVAYAPVTCSESSAILN